MAQKDIDGGGSRTQSRNPYSLLADTVAQHMTTSFILLPEELTVREALTEHRSVFAEADDTSYVFLSDDEDELVGVVSLRELLVCDDDETFLLALSSPVTAYAAPHATAEEAARELMETDLRSLPVIDHNRLVGVLTADEAGQILQDEATEDFERIASTTGSLPPGQNFKNAGIWALYRGRVVWLVLLVFGNIFSGAGIAHFEDLIAQSVTLVFFLPLLVDSGGNAGSQAATLMVRSLATGSVRLRDWGGLLGREAAISSMLGVTMAVAVSLIGIVRGGPEITVIVAVSMLVIVMLGSMIGMSLPFILAKLRLDPAHASAPLVTSICDAVGVLVYFGIAQQFLL